MMTITLQTLEANSRAVASPIPDETPEIKPVMKIDVIVTYVFI